MKIELRALDFTCIRIPIVSIENRGWPTKRWARLSRRSLRRSYRTRVSGHLWRVYVLSLFTRGRKGKAIKVAGRSHPARNRGEGAKTGRVWGVGWDGAVGGTRERKKTKKVPAGTASIFKLARPWAGDSEGMPRGRGGKAYRGREKESEGGGAETEEESGCTRAALSEFVRLKIYPMCTVYQAVAISIGAPASVLPPLFTPSLYPLFSLARFTPCLARLFFKAALPPSLPRTHALFSHRPPRPLRRDIIRDSSIIPAIKREEKRGEDEARRARKDGSVLSATLL